MGRNLVVCLDGTSNKYDATNTNVVKLYAMLDRAADDQLGYYQTGIGTFAPPGVWGKLKRWVVTRIDLAIAWLLEDHVTSAYRFLMRYYEEGDRIYIFGFSRGAYSARVLAAMLYKVGLLGRGNEELVPFAWNVFERQQDFELARGFRRAFSRKVPVHFLGLWDTVSSVGWARDKHFEYTANNPGVAIVRHAVALDERRTYFVQNLWTAKVPEGQDVKQVWFPGVHCDVGGGYPDQESGLALLALAWIVREAEAGGLRMNPKAKAAILSDTVATPAGPVPVAPVKHESLSGWWWIPEYLPKTIKDPGNNFEPRWIWPRGRCRYVSSGSVIHAAVLERMRGDAGYKPANLPRDYTPMP